MGAIEALHPGDPEIGPRADERQDEGEGHEAVLGATRRRDATHAVGFSPPEALGRAELVEQRLTDAIVAGVLRDGEKLPSESELAKSLGVAVVTAREALEGMRDKGPFELAIMPIGAYMPWITNHCNPEQALKMTDAAGAKYILPIHHQTFKLGWEPMREPIQRLEKALSSTPERLAIRQIGGTFVLPRQCPSPSSVMNRALSSSPAIAQ